MTDHKMKQVLTWMNYYIVMYTAVAYLCLVYWLFFTEARKLIEEALKEFKNPQLILAILFSILAKYMSVAALDPPPLPPLPLVRVPAPPDDRAARAGLLASLESTT